MCQLAAKADANTAGKRSLAGSNEAGLVLRVEVDGQNDDAHKALLRCLLRIAGQARGEV